MAWASEINREKDSFAFAWLKTGDSWQAALSVFGATNAGRALQVSAEWVFDPYVLKKREELLAEFGEEYFLPSRSEMARKILKLVEETNDKKLKLEAMRQYNELMGFIVKPEAKSVKLSGVVAVPMSKEELKL